MSNIEWTDATWNPVVGCTPVSPGCLNCYAATMARRLEAMGRPEYQRRDTDADGGGIRIAEVRGGRAVFTGEVRTLPDRLTDPLHWRKPRRVFVNSMSDLFHEAVPFGFIDRVWETMGKCRRHTFQILTKRPERMAAYFEDVRRSAERKYGQSLVEDPLPNVWLGTSVENQATADERIPHLLRCPASVRFLSVEPQIAPIEYRDEWADGLHWCIGGGESGPGARPYDTAWARAGITWTRMHGIAWFQKQLGARPFWDGCGLFANDPPCPTYLDLINGRERRVLRTADRKGGDPSEWPADLRVREFPQAASAAGGVR